jgi:hypothetical protein
MVWAVCSLVVLAGDIWPIDVISHIPVLCEDNEIPYVYVPAKEVRLLSVSRIRLNLKHCTCSIASQRRSK